MHVVSLGMSVATIDVLKRGNSATVFLDDGGRPLPIPSFENQPVGAPFSCRVMELPAHFPGVRYRFVEEVRPPQPEVADQVSDADIAAQKAGTLTTPTRAAELPFKQAAAPSQPSVDVLAKRLLDSFAAQARALVEGDEAGKAELEAVGTFLINTFPELEDALTAAAKPPPAALPKKRFTL